MFVTCGLHPIKTSVDTVPAFIIDLFFILTAGTLATRSMPTVEDYYWGCIWLTIHELDHGTCAICIISYSHSSLGHASNISCSIT
jgi:hypothetical protein